MLKPAELHSPWYACSVFRRQTDKYFKCYLHQVLQLILVDEKYLPVNSVSNNWICSHEKWLLQQKNISNTRICLVQWLSRPTPAEKPTCSHTPWDPLKTKRKTKQKPDKSWTHNAQRIVILSPLWPCSKCFINCSFFPLYKIWNTIQNDGLS